MYIIDLISDSYPTEQPWGTNEKHIPLNVRETVESNQDGEEHIKYVYDVVEKVPLPITISNIVKTAAIAKFGDGILEYVAANIYKTTDPKIVEYTAFCQEISNYAAEMNYTD